MKKVLSLIATSLIWGSLSVFSQKAIEFQFDDGSQHRVLTNNIESILYESTGDNQYKQIINTHAFVFESSVKASDRVRLTNVEWPEAISYTKDIGEWDEIICYRDGSMMGLKYRSGSDEFKDLILISPTDTLFCHVIFDEDGMPKKIFINDGYYYVNSYTDTSINLTLVVGDSLVCPLGDVPVDLSAESRPATRGWSQMGTKSKLAIVLKAITGITVATTSFAAGVATITAGSTVVGTIAVVGFTGYSIFSGGQLVWGSIKRAFDIGSKPEDSSIVSEIAQEVAENTVEKVVETATEQKTWNLWKVIKDKKGEVLKKAPKSIASFAVDILSDIFIDDLEDTGDKEDLLKEMYNVGGLGISGLSIDNFFAMAHKAKIKGIINPQLLKLHGVWQDVKFYIHIPEGYGGPREILISEDQIDANGKFECVIDNLQPDTEYYCGIVYYNKTHGPSMSVYEHFTTMTLTTGNAVQDKTTPQNYTVSGNVKQLDNLKGLRECSMGIRYTQYKEELDDMSSAVLSKDVPLKDGDFTVKLTGLDTQKTYYYCTYVYSPNTFDYDRGEIRSIVSDDLPKIISCKMGETQLTTDGFILSEIKSEATYECKEGETGWGIAMIAMIDGEKNLVGRSEVIPSNQKEAINPQMTFAGSIDDFIMDYTTFTATWRDELPIQVVPFIDYQEGTQTKRDYIYDAAVPFEDKIIYTQEPILLFRNAKITNIEKDNDNAISYWETEYGLIGSAWLERIELMKLGSDFISTSGKWALDDFMDGINTLNGQFTVQDYPLSSLLGNDLNIIYYMKLNLCNGTTRPSGNCMKFKNNEMYITGVEVVDLPNNLKNASTRLDVPQRIVADDNETWKKIKRTKDFMKSSVELLKDIKRFSNRHE